MFILTSPKRLEYSVTLHSLAVSVALDSCLKSGRARPAWLCQCSPAPSALVPRACLSGLVDCQGRCPGCNMINIYIYTIIYVYTRTHAHLSLQAPLLLSSPAEKRGGERSMEKESGERCRRMEKGQPVTHHHHFRAIAPPVAAAFRHSAAPAPPRHRLAPPAR